MVDNLGATKLVLDSTELKDISDVSQLPAEYPGWMLQVWSSGRAKQVADSARR